jgi:hypothetical protein
MPVTPTQPTTRLFLVEELDDTSRTRELAQGDVEALRAVADWITTFVASSHEDLGRAGPVCPFVPGALVRNTLWLAPERVRERSVPEVVELVRRYQRLFKDAQPTDGDDATYKSFVVVFTDLVAERATEFFGGVLEQLAVPSYVDDGFVMGGFHERNEGTAIYNASFRPFTSPVPFLLVRQAVVSDWKFFLDNEEWLNRWASRYPDEGSKALAEELRRLPWRAGRAGESLRALGGDGGRWGGHGSPPLLWVGPNSSECPPEPS